eukprot:365042-Chlamydomonas_euryale.AAC.10
MQANAAGSNAQCKRARQMGPADGGSLRRMSSRCRTHPNARETQTIHEDHVRSAGFAPPYR